MSLVTCRCGKSKMNFLKLTPVDFGSEGWQNHCCKDIQEMSVLQGITEEPKEKKSRKKREKKED